MNKKIFVTGTDTGVGKTLVSAGLLAAALKEGNSTLGIKPVAAGCFEKDGILVNEDALILQEFSSIKLPYQQVNPVALEPAIAPHIAASQAGKRLQVDRIAGICRGALLHPMDLCVVEGAGGWRVPLGPRETFADLAINLAFDVVLVVGMRLGCINHALLTAEAIYRDGLKVVGWVANQIDPVQPVQKENFDTLARMLPAPCIGWVPYFSAPTPEQLVEYLDISFMV